LAKRTIKQDVSGKEYRLIGNWRDEATYGGEEEIGGNPLNRDKSAGTGASD